MSEHIEEPWKKFRDASGCGISSINGDLIAEGLSEVDSDRIVACVNSLAGVPDELLQDDDKNIINRYTEHLKKETVRQADLLAEVTEERDALKAELEAAKKQEPFACYVGEGFIKYPAMNIASIKKAAEKFGYEFAELYTLPPVPAQECTFHGFDAQACMERSKEAPCEPVNHNSIPDFLLEMSRQMRHQDSRSTSHPFWQVRCHRYIPTEQGYNDHHWEICGDEGVIYRSTEEIELLQDYLIENHSEFLNARNEYHDAVDIGEWLRDDINEDDLPDGLRMIYVQQVEEVVSTHFTEHDARGFIERQQHNYPKLYTYVESAYWSPQIRKLQDWIISLTAERQNG